MQTANFIPLDEDNSLKETEYIMSSPEMVERIKKAQQEIKEGKGKSIDIKELWFPRES